MRIEYEAGEGQSAGQGKWLLAPLAKGGVVLTCGGWFDIMIFIGCGLFFNGL